MYAELTITVIEDVLGNEGTPPCIVYFRNICMSGELHTPAAFAMVKESQQWLDATLGGLQSRGGR